MRARPSRQDLRDDVAFDVGQAEVAALELVGELFVVDPQQPQHRRVQVVHVDGILDDVVAELVGAADGHARLGAAAGQPHRERPRMVIAP